MSRARRQLFIAALIGVSITGCRIQRSTRAPHTRDFDVTVTETHAPYDTRWPGSGAGHAQCDSQRWITTYRWTDRNGDREPNRPERLTVITRCAGTSPPGSAPTGGGQIDVDGEARIHVSGGGTIGVGGGDGGDGSIALTEFGIAETSNATVVIINAKGKQQAITNASSIDFYTEVVIVRTANGGGWLVPRDRFVEVRWTRKPEPEPEPEPD